MKTLLLAKHAKEHQELADAQRQGKLGLELPKGCEDDEGGKVIRNEVEHALVSIPNEFLYFLTGSLISSRMKLSRRSPLSVTHFYKRRLTIF